MMVRNLEMSHISLRVLITMMEEKEEVVVRVGGGSHKLSFGENP